MHYEGIVVRFIQRQREVVSRHGGNVNKHLRIIAGARRLPTLAAVIGFTVIVSYRPKIGKRLFILSVNGLNCIGRSGAITGTAVSMSDSDTAVQTVTFVTVNMLVLIA